MKKILAIIVISVIGYFAYASFSKATSLNSDNKEVSHSLSPQNRLPLKIFIAADATGSINDNGVSKLTTDQLKRVIDTLKSTGGQLALLIINGNSEKSPILRIAIQKQPIKPIFPVQAISETAFNFGQRLQLYQKNQKKFLTDSINYYTKSIPLMKNFLKHAETLLTNAYTHLAQTSDCIGALKVSQGFQAEPTRNNIPMRHITLLISDMVNTARVNKSKLSLPHTSNIEYYIVRTRRVKGSMPPEIKYKEFNNIDACLNVIL